MTTLDFPPTRFLADRTASIDSTSRLTRFGVAMVQLHNDLWRITRATGEVLGYIEAYTDNTDADFGARRYRAKRMRSAQRASVPLGEFWSIDDAVDCFRFN